MPMWEAIKRRAPDVEDGVVVRQVGTPLTHARFLKRHRGNYGLATPPRIVRFRADDPADLDSEYGPGDLLRITFDVATDRGVADVDAERRRLEDHLEGLRFADDLEQREVDVGAAFHEARHSASFRPVDGGWLWVVRSRRSGEPEATASGTAADGVPAGEG